MQAADISIDSKLIEKGEGMRMYPTPCTLKGRNELKNIKDGKY